MNKNKLKIFATTSRVSLLSSVKEHLEQLKVDSPQTLPRKYEEGVLIEDRSFTVGNKKRQREDLIRAVVEKGKEQLIEEMAYTWFNRFVAIYFMQENGYLNYGFDILPTSNSSRLEPEVVINIHKANIPNLDKNKAIELSNAGKFNELYNYILLLVCNDLHTRLPFLFERLDDYSELLIPSDLLIEGSIIQKIAKETDVKDWKEVEVIGWLYQYYISDKKDELIKAKKKYKDKDIPAVTQLFTPDWIVRYMVQNSLGRYWVESKSDERIKKDWEFYIDSRDPNYKDEVKKLGNSALSPEDITVLDPACGSGHILVYAFEVLYSMYKASGYVEKEIPQLILSKNLFGLEIDQRAGQLAQLSLYLKARSYDERIFEKVSHLNIVIIKGSKAINDEHLDILANGDKNLREYCETFIEQFKDADVLGSIIKVKNYDEALLNKALNNLSNSRSIFGSTVREIFPTLCEQARIMNSKFDILVANPPYMGGKYMNEKLGKYVKDNYPDTKSDLFSVFIERMLEWTKSTGQLGVMCPYVWMFIQSYKELRKIIVETKNISSLVQLEYNAFENACIPICIFTIRNHTFSLSGDYIQLASFTGPENQPIKTIDAIRNLTVPYRYSANTSEFKKIPDMPIAYELSPKAIESFIKPKVSELYNLSYGLFSCDNEKFIKYWFEVNFIDSAIIEKVNPKWFPHNKGGDFRKWYGNHYYFVNFQNNGNEIRKFRKSQGQSTSLPGENYYFKEHVSWSLISSHKFGVRFYPKDFIFDIAAPSIIIGDNDISIVGLLLSKVTEKYLNVLNPTLNYPTGSIGNIPVLNIVQDKTKELVINSIEISKLDWNSREYSWNFKQNELIRLKSSDGSLQSSIKNYIEYWTQQFFQLHKNEEDLNKIFIEIYGLQDELTPDVPLSDITILKDEISERNEETKTIKFDELVIIKQFISYAVGCMLGRYSIDIDGLAYAGGKFDSSKSQTFKADKDGVIPIISDERFEDDISSRFKEFVKVVFGEKNYSTNLEYIANILGRKENETSIECIRRYFLNDFYKDHVKMYKKRPIYWLYSSGKEKGFNALVYMHRYKKETISILRMDYLHKLQRSYNVDLDTAEKQERETNESRLKIQLQKKIIHLKTLIQELKQYDELLRHYADKQIEIDLDDGVVVNYAKFKELLVKI